MFRRNPEYESEEMDKTLALKWLNQWLNITGGKKKLRNLPDNIEKFFKRNNNYTKLYRGLSFTDSMISKYLHTLTEMDTKKYKVGDYIPIKLTELTSWTAIYDFAANYADSYRHDYLEQFKKDLYENYKKDTIYGIILQLENVKRYSVLADVDKTFESDDNNEIILYPGTFRCKIIKVYKNGKEQESLTFDLEKYNSID